MIVANLLGNVIEMESGQTGDKLRFEMRDHGSALAVLTILYNLCDNVAISAVNKKEVHYVKSSVLYTTHSKD